MYLFICVSSMWTSRNHGCHIPSGDSPFLTSHLSLFLSRTFCLFLPSSLAPSRSWPCHISITEGINQNKCKKRKTKRKMSSTFKWLNPSKGSDYSKSLMPLISASMLKLSWHCVSILSSFFTLPNLSRTLHLLY